MVKLGKLPRGEWSMGIITAPIEGIVRKPKVRSLGYKGYLARLIPPLTHILFQKIAQRYFYIKARSDYRRVALWARRLGEEWNHNEAMLVAQVESYLKERESC